MQGAEWFESQPLLGRSSTTDTMTSCRQQQKLLWLKTWSGRAGGSCSQLLPWAVGSESLAGWSGIGVGFYGKYLCWYSSLCVWVWQNLSPKKLCQPLLLSVNPTLLRKDPWQGSMWTAALQKGDKQLQLELELQQKEMGWLGQAPCPIYTECPGHLLQTILGSKTILREACLWISSVL